MKKKSATKRAGKRSAKPTRGKRPAAAIAPRRTPVAPPVQPPPPKGSDIWRKLALACARAADDKQGEDTLLLDVRGLSPIADWVIVTTGTSTPHLKALADAVAEAVETTGGRLHHTEGDPRAAWILLDAHGVLVHIFDAPARRHYDLERLWGDARRVTWA